MAMVGKVQRQIPLEKSLNRRNNWKK